MLEYVILLTFFSCALVAWSSTIYTDWGGFVDYEHDDFGKEIIGGFGSLGQGIVEMFQRVMSGISLPVP